MSVATTEVPALVGEIRAFNRFYTDLIGTLDKHYLESPFTLPEARIVFEIATHPGSTATQLRTHAHYDQGHLSRILARLEEGGFVEKRPTPEDGRAKALHLTVKGKRAFKTMDARARRQAEAMIDHLDGAARRRLHSALDAIRALLGSDPEAADAPVTIREGGPGDVGLLLHRHALVYRHEFGFGDVFERYVAEGLAPYLANRDPTKDRLWIAETDGRPVGTVALHHDPDRPGWAKLRWYLVEKEARGRGLGRTLLRLAVDFTQNAGYEGIYLWTVDTLDAARRQYQQAGFRLVEETDGCPWAEWAKEQRWELRIDQAS